MAYTLEIRSDKLIDILNDHYDPDVYPNITEESQITRVTLRGQYVEIVIEELYFKEE